MEIVTDPKDIKELKKIDDLIEKEFQFQKIFFNKKTLPEGTLDKELISIVNSYKKCAHDFYKKGQIIQPYLDSVFGKTDEPNSMNVMYRAKIDNSLQVRQDGMAMVEDIKKYKIAVRPKDIEGWWIFDPQFMHFPIVFPIGGVKDFGYDESSFNIVDIDYEISF